MTEQIPTTMLAGVIRRQAAPPEISRVPVPSRPPGHCLVRIEAAALQPVELFIASGRFYDGPPEVPYVPGLEGVGVVAEGDRLTPGTRVRVEVVHPGYGLDGCFADYVVVAEEANHSSAASRSRVEPIRTDLPSDVIAAVGSSGSTAKLVLERAASVHGPIEGKHVLVLGATGAVGELLVQLCKIGGAGRVIAAGRKPDRLAKLRSLGADEVVELGNAGLEAQAQALHVAANGQIDVVLDPLWGEPAAAALDATSVGAVHVNFGQSAGPRAPLSGVALRSRRVTIVGHSGARAPQDDLRRSTNEILEDVAAGRVSLTQEIVPLEDLPNAWDRQAASPGAKLVIVPKTAAR